MTVHINSNTSKGAKHAKNDFYNLCALCVLCGELFGNGATNTYLRNMKGGVRDYIICQETSEY